MVGHMGHGNKEHTHNFLNALRLASNLLLFDCYRIKLTTKHKTEYKIYNEVRRKCELNQGYRIIFIHMQFYTQFMIIYRLYNGANEQTS